MKSKRYILEPERRTPLAGSCDVAVAGGGIAGVAAAVAAARNGADVWLIEKENALGGLATLGLVAIYLPLCDGRGNQVIGGLGEQLLKLSLKYGAGSIPECWLPGGDQGRRRRERYRAVFNPAAFMIALEELALAEGVKPAYDSRCCGLVKDDSGMIEAVIVENKSGRIAVGCAAVVDATGDADIAFMAGEQTVSLDTNRRAGWFFSSDGHGRRLHQLHDPLYSDPPPGVKTFAGDDWCDVTQMNIESRKLILKELQKYDSFPEKRQPLLLPALPQFRMTRRLKGCFELDDAESHRMFDDGIGLTGDWRRSGPVYCIPFRCLAAEETPNLLTAGRCISVTDSMWDITRAIPACAVSGEAAGTAAALAAGRRADIRSLDMGRLKGRLSEQGVIMEMP